MRSRVNIFVILLTLDYLASGHVSSSLDVSKREIKDSSSSSSSLAPITRDDFGRKLKRPVTVKIHRPAVTSLISTRNKISLTKGNVKGIPKVGNNATIVTAKTNKLALIHDLSLSSEAELERRDKRRKHKRTRRRAIMALLLAYKLKFAALVPVIAGGVIMLLSTTALAGFFFALFAAVLGLKGH